MHRLCKNSQELQLDHNSVQFSSPHCKNQIYGQVGFAILQLGSGAVFVFKTEMVEG